MDGIIFSNKAPETKKLVRLVELKSPPLSETIRHEVGLLLRRLQYGEKIEPPFSKPIKGIGKNCHELKIRDSASNRQNPCLV